LIINFNEEPGTTVPFSSDHRIVTS